jgi:ABC-type branched-subunit amino acid transport system substrate-binding protein
MSKVTLGQSAALSGPTSALGQGMKDGARAYFKGNKNVVLKASDDKYEPVICRKNTNNFISRGIDVLFGYVGTPTAKVCAPIAMKAKKIFFGPFTGASFLSDVKNYPYSFSIRATYGMETEKMVDMLVKSGKKKIAIFVQDDGFGEIGKKGVVAALKKRGLTLTGEGRYKRNTLRVTEGIESVIKSKADGVIMIGAYGPCSAAIKALRKGGVDAPVLNISFVGSKAMSAALGKDTKNVFVSQVIPDPWNTKLPIVKEYQSKIDKDKIGFISFEGYIAARVLDEALKNIKYNMTSSDQLKAEIEKLNFDLGGLSVKFGKDDHRALSETYMTAINSDGSFTYVTEL